MFLMYKLQVTSASLTQQGATCDQFTAGITQKKKLLKTFNIFSFAARQQNQSECSVLVVNKHSPTMLLR